MKIRNLNAYISAITEKPLSERIGHDEEPLFRALIGPKKVKKYIGNIANFAADPTYQIFYEFLQNADDAESSLFLINFDKDGLLVLNNGAPFATDGFSKQGGQLWNFLGIDSSQKGLGKKGEYGRGSKLLYDLLLERTSSDNGVAKKEQEKRQIAIYEKLKGPFLFSWNSTHHLEHFSVADFENLRFSDDYSDIDDVLLTKLIFTYYPASPKEERIINNQLTKLFTKTEFDKFKKGVERLLPKDLNISPYLQQGTILYIPLGAGQAENLITKLDKIRNGIASSFPFLEHVEQVFLMTKKVSKLDFEELKFELDSADKEKHEVTLAYPKESIDLKDSLTNFYKDFPITDEIHGFKFILNSSSFEIKEDRQVLDLTKPRNKSILFEFVKKIIDRLEKLILSKNRSEYLPLFKVFLCTDAQIIRTEKPFLRENFYEPILEFIKQNIPIENGFIGAEYAIIKSFESEIDLVKLGRNDLKWVHPALNDYQSYLEEIEVYPHSILELLTNENTNIEHIRTWIEELKENDYYKLLGEITEEDNWLTEIEDLPIIKFESGVAHSLTEIKQEDSFVFLIPSQKSIRKIVARNTNFKVACIRAKAAEEFTNDVGELVDSKGLMFKRILAAVGNDLSISEKSKLFRILSERYISLGKFASEITFFQNGYKDNLPLAFLDDKLSESFPSGLLDYFQILVSERTSDLTPYFGDKNRYKKLLLDNWEVVKSKLLKSNKLSSNIAQIYSDFGALYKNKEEGDKGILKEWRSKAVFYNGTDFLTTSEVFINRYSDTFKKEAYLKEKQLVEKITSLNCLTFKAFKALPKLPFNIRPSRLEDLRESISPNIKQLELSEEELLLLYQLRKNNSDNFFAFFTITQEINGKYIVTDNHSKNKQYYSEDERIIKFLSKKDNYFLLPESLCKHFEEDTNLPKDGVSFMEELREKFGSKKAFIHQIANFSKSPEVLNLQAKYLNNIPKDNLSLSEEDEMYERDGFITLLLNMANDSNNLEFIEEDIRINNEPLTFYKFSDKLSLNVNDKLKEFYLSKLLPKQYASEKNALYNVLEKFEDSSIRKLPIFEVNQKEPSLIKVEIIKEGVQNGYQLAFIIGYFLTKKGKEDDDKQRIKAILKNVDSTEALTALKKKYILSFNKIYYPSGFNPKHILFEAESALSIKDERLPDWVEEWIQQGNDEEQKERINFLKKSGTSSIKQKVIELRQNLINGKKNDKQLIDTILKRKTWINNTLKWASKKIAPFESSTTKGSALTRLIIEGADSDESIKYVLKLVDYKTDSEKPLYKVTKLDSDENYYYFRHVKEPFQKLLEQAEKLNFSIINGSSSFHKLIKKFKEQNIQRIFIQQQVIKEEIKSIQEWDKSFYKTWKNNQEVKHSIWLTKENLPLKYELRLGEQRQIPLQKEQIDKICFDEQTKEIFINQYSVDKNILLTIEKYKDKYFTTRQEKDQLINLFSLSVASQNKEVDDNSVYQALEEKYNYTPEDIARIIADFQTNGIGERGNGTGGVQLDREISDLEKDALNDLINSLSEEQLIKLTDNLEAIIRAMAALDEKDPKIDPVAGYFGEKLTYHWLDNLKRWNNSKIKEIQYVGDQPDMGRYDIELKTANNKDFEIDVKTTKRPLRLDNHAVPFYLHLSQYNHLIEDRANNFSIIRISLKDLGLIEVKDKYEELNVETKAALDREAIEFFSKPGNVDEFTKHKLTFWVSYNDFFEDIFE